MLRIKNIFVLLLVSNFCFAQTDLTNGLMAYYPFNGNSNDESNNNNYPTINTATLTADRFGNAKSAVHFNGSSSFIKIPNRPGLNFIDKITLSVWVRPTGFYYDLCHASTILSKGTADYYPGNYALRFDDALFSEGSGCSGERLKDSLHQNFRGTGTPVKAYTPFITPNKWYHLVYNNDGDTARLYVDCDLKYAIAFKETFTNIDDLYLGKTEDEMFPFWLNGDLDDVRIYNRALTKTEIDSLCFVETKKPEPKNIIVSKPLEKRENELKKQLIVEHDSITVTLYDNGYIDGDSVTLIYNNEIITTHQRLSDQPLSFTVKVKPGIKNELVMYAENLGLIPPNTALMIVTDGKKRYEVNVSSSQNRNGVIAFWLKE